MTTRNIYIKQQENNLDDMELHRIHKNQHVSSDDLYKGQNPQHFVPQYHSPPYSNRIIQSPNIVDQQQQQYTIIKEEDDRILLFEDPTKRSISPIYTSSVPKRTHKRSNSHNPPSKSILYTNSPPISSNQPPLYISSPPNIKSPPIIYNSNYINSNNNSNKNITWSPSATKKKGQLKTSLDPSIFLPLNGGGLSHTSLSHGSSPVDGRSPPLSPRNSNSNNINVNSNPISINHKRGVSWEPQLQGKSFEALNQLIKEKKESILQREKELLLKQKIIDSKLSSSPPSSGGSIPIPQSSGTTQVVSTTTSGPSSPPISMMAPIQQPPVRVLKHNRSKSDTTTILKLNNALKKSGVTNPSQQPVNNYIIISEPMVPQNSTSTTTTTTTTTILSPTPSPIPKLGKDSVGSGVSGNKSPSYQNKLYTTTSPRTPPFIITTPQQQQQQQQENYMKQQKQRRKSVDPNTLIHQHHIQQQQHYLTPTLNSATSKLKTSTYNLQQLLSSLKSWDLDEFEEEIDKEIQQVILQTKNIQGKVDLLERVRCTAPDPLLMLFGENCKNINTTTTSTNNNNNNGNSNNINNSKSPNIKYNKFISSPHLYQVPSSNNNNNVYYPASEHSTTIIYNEFSNGGRGCPDKSKSKNLNSLPRSSAFSPPPRN
ncbi:hypothetical protein DLAC_09655 [Tieghemostelium lacteum]|uniref:Uncharacterized protein n=1 Tax=Tieghemostelium lacteum TaxID=361077 RepID=A0A151Z6X5_TIELA|nr:hypothetical protein DLAC_09655 [Tieghemostelium lacteum]|eukprot:KYQ89688.1 hypothetical protein DLAC_09655 [Tieghemostelium lacteum]